MTTPDTEALKRLSRLAARIRAPRTPGAAHFDVYGIGREGENLFASDLEALSTPTPSQEQGELREKIAKRICSSRGRDPNVCVAGSGSVSLAGGARYTCHRYAWEDETAVADAILALLPSQAGAWRPIDSAPKGPVSPNHINDFLPSELGPLILMIIPFNPPSVTVGFWSPEGECWRHMDDDGPNDISPTYWMPLPPAPGAS